MQQTRGPGQARTRQGTAAIAAAGLPRTHGARLRERHPGHLVGNREEDIVLKYIVATHRTQGERDNDSTSVPDGELVDIPGKSHEDPDDTYCACARSFAGFSSRQATTTAEVVESDMTPAGYIRRFHTMLLALGYENTAAVRTDALNDAVHLLLIAAQWPVGTVVERRGDEVRVRSFPDET